MSGPAYPPGRITNGAFQTSVNPDATLVPFDQWSTVISQYGNSPVLDQLIGNLNQYLDTSANFDSFYNNIININTAVGYGLDVWGRIVGVNRVVKVTNVNYFGFNEASPGASPFGQDAFYSGAPLTSNYALADNAYRTLIFAKASTNITNGSIPAINRILMNLFPNRGNAYVTEGLIANYFGFQEAQRAFGFNQQPFYSGQPLPLMTMTYTFNFQLTPVELAIVQNSGVLPKTTGVLATVVVSP